jgi:hypothetical protein
VRVSRAGQGKLDEGILGCAALVGHLRGKYLVLVALAGRRGAILVLTGGSLAPADVRSLRTDRFEAVGAPPALRFAPIGAALGNHAVVSHPDLR